MDSERLSKRARQPGHDQSFRASEANFVEAVRACLDPSEYLVEAQPSDLRDLFATPTGMRNLGVVPEAKIQSVKTGKRFFIEVKKQGDNGNAEERAMKHHTVQFYKTLHDRYGYPYHPFVTVFCESLAVHPRYTSKFEYLIEPGQYFLWVDYDLDRLCEFIGERCRLWLG